MPLFVDEEGWGGAGRMKVRVRVGSLDEESSQDEEAFYDVSSGRLSRWERVAIAAVKQSLRCTPLPPPPRMQPLLLVAG